jgi:hypothetical protein
MKKDFKIKVALIKTDYEKEILQPTPALFYLPATVAERLAEAPCSWEDASLHPSHT